MHLEGKTAVVVGLGASGIAAVRLLADRGARVIGMDAQPRDRLPLEVLRGLELRGVKLALGGHDDAAFRDADFVIVSPGVPAFDALAEVEASGREVIGELELASRFITEPIVLIGGTNGKSTTTALVGEMLTHAGKKVFVGGNFGTPLSEAVGGPYTMHVVEISSFQAERVPTLHARAHALLNVTDDHLDRYPSFDAYAQAKGTPFERMTGDDVAVIPADDEVVLRQARRGQARIVTFSAEPRHEVKGVYRTSPTDDAPSVGVVGDAIVDESSGAAYPLRLIRVSGRHNVANVCAAIAVASAMGADRGAIETALALFEGLAHRTVLVGEIGDVRFYDDSKGTNVGASIAALRGLMEQKVVLIAGGRDKLGSYKPLVEALRGKGRALVVIGEAADRIAAAAAGAVDTVRASSMPEAVRKARELALPGDAVLLSPACSSFDMFRDYKDRGDSFVRAVRTLIEEASS